MQHPDGVEPRSAEYETARQRAVWQTRIPDRHPARISSATHPDQVIDAVRAASRRDAPVSVISGGHSYIGAGLRDRSVLLDLTQLRRIVVSPEKRQAYVEVGVTNELLDLALAEHGLAFPVGHSPSVALGGYLLGGGLGWNSEAWGQAACFEMTAVDVVLADGTMVRATPEQEADLFWAARGAGPLFPGIVTGFTVNLRARPQSIVRMSRSYHLDAEAEVSAWIGRVLDHKSDSIEMSVLFSCSEPLYEPILTLDAVAFGENASSARRALADLGELPPDAGAVSSLNYAETSIPALMEENDNPPARYAVETTWTADTTSTLRALAAVMRDAPSTLSVVHVSFRRDPTVRADGAFSLADRNLCFLAAVWSDGADDPANVAWCDALNASLAHLCSGHYINETDYVRNPAAAAASFTPEAFSRIQRVRARYDPEARLHLYSDLPA